MSESLISIPSKTTSEIDWVQPLKTLFAQAGVSTDFEAQLTELNKLRNQVVARHLDKSVTTVEALQRYHDQVGALESKISSELLKIEFTWEDAFDKGTLFIGRKSLSLPFFAYERLCILFNLAAFESQLAAEHRIADSDDELKTVAKWFQSASGIFAHLASLVTILPEEGLTGDLNPDTLSALTALMLAQAQEIFVTKAIKDRMKDSIIAKLSIQAEDMFGDALLKMTKDKVKFLWDRSWLTDVAGRKLSYSALAQFFQSKTCGVNKRIGEQIARLNLCLELLKKAQDKTGNVTLFSYYVSEAGRMVAEVKKDNDFIYHEQVPNTDNLPTIEKVPSARLAKPLKISHQLFADFKDAFENLSPISAISLERKLPTPAITAPVKDTEKANTTAESGGTPKPPRPPPPQFTPPSSAPTAEATNGNSEESTTPTGSEASDSISSPLKIVFDASLNAMGYYLQQYLQTKRIRKE